VENPDVIRRIEKLPPQKKEILKCFCRGMSIRQIAEKFFIGEGTVRSHMTQIYVKLELDLISVDARRAVLLRLYCEAFDKYVRGSEYKGEKALVDLSPESFEKEAEEEEEKMSKKDKERSEEANEMIDSDHKKIIKLRPRDWEKIDDTGLMVGKEEPRRNPNPFQVGLFLFALIGFATVAIILYGLLTGNFQLIRPNQEQAVQQEQVEQQPTQAQAQIQEEPTQIIQPTAIPTNAETSTPAPTPLPKPVILFEDDFEGGLSDAWEVVSGNPVVVNGMLSSDRDTWVVVGDPAWTNYSVEFDADTFSNWYNWGYNVFGIRIQDIDQMYAYKWTTEQTEWYVIENGDWNVMPQSDQRLGSGMKNFRIVANGDSITMYVDGVNVYSFYSNKYPQGRVGFLIGAETIIDNFKIKEILE